MELLFFGLLMVAACSVLYIKLDLQGRPSVGYLTLLVVSAAIAGVVGLMSAAILCDEIWRVDWTSSPNDPRWLGYVVMAGGFLGSFVAIGFVFWLAHWRNPSRLREHRGVVADYDDKMVRERKPTDGSREPAL